MGDREAGLVKSWIEAKRAAGKGDAELEGLLAEAYEQREYHKQSNGCNLVTELRWPFPRHPACVVHDMLYGDRRGRKYADSVMKRLNGYFGRPVAGWFRWAGLRLGGWWVYRQQQGA